MKVSAERRARALAWLSCFAWERAKHEWGESMAGRYGGPYTAERRETCRSLHGGTMLDAMIVRRCAMPIRRARR